MTRIAIPALVVMIAVAGFVAAAGWNSSGDPRLVMALTERELSLPDRFGPRRDDPGLQLLIQYERRYDPLESRNWLPESRLREIGFSLYVPVGSPDAVHTYDHVPPRVAWVVFEYDGPEWRAIERRRELQPEHLRLRPGLGSRLVPVDAGPDYDQLLARYPSGHLILQGVIGLAYVAAENGGPLVHGTLRDVVPARVTVPYRFRSLLRQLGEGSPAAAAGPRYEAELAVGTLGMPYIRAVRLTQN